MAWLFKHAEVSTVFISEHADAGLVVPHGQNMFRAKEKAYARAWAGMPSSVRNIVILRDVPRNSLQTMSCVEGAIERHAPSASACAVPRDLALMPDAAAAAARRSADARVSLLDLTHYFCSQRWCFPVIGGALVHKDTDHMTAEFAATLGPYVSRALDSLRPPWTIRAPQLRTVAFSATAQRAENEESPVRYAAHLRVPLRWGLAFRSSEHAIARLTFAKAGPCKVRIPVSIAGVGADPRPDVLIQEAPLSGHATLAAGAAADWVTWMSAESGAVRGTWIERVNGQRLLQVEVNAHALEACATEDMKQVRSEVAWFLSQIQARALS